MNKDDIIKEIDNNSLRVAAKNLNVSYSTLRYWIDKHKIVRTRKSLLSKHECEMCGETNQKNFYGRRKSLCKKCQNIQSVDKWISIKNKAIKYKGGSCMHCGYSKFYGALEFHHRDPSKKDFVWNKLRLKPWTEITKELDKCDLLCANCHREVHDLNS